MTLVVSFVYSFLRLSNAAGGTPAPAVYAAAVLGVNLIKRFAMETWEIREKLIQYLQYADERKVQAIYVMVEDDMADIQDIWNDPAFIAELDRRSAELKSGAVKGKSWEEVKAELLNNQRPQA